MRIKEIGQGNTYNFPLVVLFKDFRALMQGIDVLLAPFQGDEARWATIEAATFNTMESLFLEKDGTVAVPANIARSLFFCMVDLFLVLFYRHEVARLHLCFSLLLTGFTSRDQEYRGLG